jgi:hypothetical protein
MNPTFVNAVNQSILALNIASAVVVAWFLAAAIAAQFVKTVRAFL